MALNILDGAPFREDPSQVIRVQRAKFEQKGNDYVPKKKAKSKKKAAGVLSKQEKELGWGGFDDKLAANKVSLLITAADVTVVYGVSCQSQCVQECSSIDSSLLCEPTRAMYTQSMLDWSCGSNGKNLVLLQRQKC